MQNLVILNVQAARSCLTLTATGCIRWHYEPRTGPAALTAVILHVLGAAPGTRPGCGPFPAL